MRWRTVRHVTEDLDHPTIVIDPPGLEPGARSNDHEPHSGDTMTHARSPDASLRPALSLLRFRVWHLWLLALFVGVAIVNIQDQGRSEPALIALATAGFVLYGLLGRGAWCLARRYRARLGTTAVLALYLVAMAVLFLAATVAYLLIEHAYLVGGFNLARFLGG
jgi:hypothetical protein